MLNSFQLSAIAAAHPDGFTIDKNTGSPITSGYAVAVQDTQNSFSGRDLEQVLDRAKLSDIDAIGGWYNSADGRYYFDAVMIMDELQDAIRAGLSNKQLAIFDLNRMDEIRLDQVAKTA